MQIRPHHNAIFGQIYTISGQVLPWTNKLDILMSAWFGIDILNVHLIRQKKPSASLN
jgi:hypothetical protein